MQKESTNRLAEEHDVRFNKPIASIALRDRAGLNMELHLFVVERRLAVDAFVARKATMSFDESAIGYTRPTLECVDVLSEASSKESLIG